MTLSREDAERVLAEYDAFASGELLVVRDLADALRAMLELHDLERRLVKQAEHERQRLIAQRDAAERGGDRNALALLDLYNERVTEARAERDSRDAVLERIEKALGDACTGDLAADVARLVEGRDAAEEHGVRCGMAFAAGMADSLAETLRSANRRKAAAEVDTMLLALNAADPAAIVAAAREREVVREPVCTTCRAFGCTTACRECRDQPQQAEARDEGEG